jgi:uncharacterized integral membrane protein
LCSRGAGYNRQSYFWGRQVKYLMWLLKAAIFFTLFAFALNNQQVVSVNFFFSENPSTMHHGL